MLVNQARAARGQDAIEAAHPIGWHADDRFTAASDTIADILHRLFDNKEGCVDSATSDEARALLDRALYAYLGDAEDNEVTV
jgi:hypothetical protein